MKEFSPQPEPKQPHAVRRVVLPSGKTIEVVSFDESTPGTGDLHVCPSCRAHLVYPLEWQEAGRRDWDILLRCPNCEWRGSGRYDQAVVERFDKELDRGTEALTRDLRQLVRANMEDDVERFVDALQCGHVLPEDF